MLHQLISDVSQTLSNPCLYSPAVPDIKTYGESSYSQSEDDGKHHYDVSDLHTWGWQQVMLEMRADEEMTKGLENTP